MHVSCMCTNKDVGKPKSIVDIPHIIHETKLHHRNRLLLFPHTIQNQTLHTERLPMLWKFLQDAIGVFDSLLVLLVLVVPDDCAEEIIFLFGQRHALPCLWVGTGVLAAHNFRMEWNRMVHRCRME